MVGHHCPKKEGTVKKFQALCAGNCAPSLSNSTRCHNNSNFCSGSERHAFWNGTVCAVAFQDQFKVLNAAPVKAPAYTSYQWSIATLVICCNIILSCCGLAMGKLWRNWCSLMDFGKKLAAGKVPTCQRLATTSCVCCETCDALVATQRGSRQHVTGLLRRNRDRFPRERLGTASRELFWQWERHLNQL